MTSLVQYGFSRNRACELSGYSRSLLYYKQRKRSIPMDPFLESRINEIVSERPSYGTRRVTAMIRRVRSQCQQEACQEAYAGHGLGGQQE